MEFSRQEYWSGLPFPSPEDLPNPGHSSTLLAPGTSFMEGNVSMDWGVGGWFQDDSNALQLLCTLFLLLLHQLHLRSLGIRFWRLGTPA